MDDAAFNAMHGRVSSLGTHMEYVRRDLDDIKVDLKEVKVALTRLDDLPTKEDLNDWRFQSRQDLNSWKLQWAGLWVGAVALIVTGIIGGLGWLETRTQRIAAPGPSPQPIIIQLPAQAQPQATSRR